MKQSFRARDISAFTVQSDWRMWLYICSQKHWPTFYCRIKLHWNQVENHWQMDEKVGGKFTSYTPTHRSRKFRHSRGWGDTVKQEVFLPYASFLWYSIHIFSPRQKHKDYGIIIPPNNLAFFSCPIHHLFCSSPSFMGNQKCDHLPKQEPVFKTINLGSFRQHSWLPLLGPLGMSHIHPPPVDQRPSDEPIPKLVLHRGPQPLQSNAW